VLGTVARALGADFPRADLGYEVPGVHWSMTDPAHPRAAEVTTGLIRTGVDLDARETGHGYRRIIDLADRVDAGGRAVAVHFTSDVAGGPGAQRYARFIDGYRGP
jgi:beta-amylase